jgi:predicted permease
MGSKPQVFVPITMRGLMEPNFKQFDNRRSYWAYVFARLKPGVTADQAKTAINVPYKQVVNDIEGPLQRGISDQTMSRFKTKELRVEPGARGQSSIGREAKGPLYLLLGVTGFVLLIACGNVANLLLARAAARSSEMAVRLSIGASRWQLVAQLLTESILLALFGGAAGMLVARWTLDLVASLLPNEIAATLQFTIDGTVMLFSAALALGTGLLFGLFPALHSTRPDLVSTLKGQAGQPAGARSASRFRTSLATLQIALSMALLAGAGFFIKSLFNISRVELGLNPENLVTFSVSPALNGYTPEKSQQLFERMEDELAALPGVSGATAALVPSLGGSNWGSDVAVEGFKAGPDTDSNARYNEVGPGYFRTMGIPLLAGREFTRADAVKAPKVAIVNEAFANKFTLGRDAVGKRIGSGSGYTSELDTEIVGLVQNAKYSQVKDEVPPLFFRPYRQDPEVGFITFYVRTSVDPESFLANIPRVLARLDANLPVENLRTMEQQVQQNVFEDRLISTLSSAFAGLATILAAVGLYGVLAYTVAQRTREIGLRIALGAAPGRVRLMILRQVGVMTIVGGIIGLAAAIALGRAAQSMLFELKGYDPVVLAVSAVLLSVVALGAGLLPAHRASQVDPMRALRYE